MRSRFHGLVAGTVLISVFWAVPAASSAAAAEPVADEAAVTNTQLPGIAGPAVVDKTLRAGPGRWDPQDVELTYRWLRDGSFVRGARERTLELSAADRGHRFAVQVSATDSDGNTGRAMSEETAKVQRATFVVRRAPEVRGVLRFTRSVRATAGTIAPRPARTSYQWLRSGKPIPGATKAAYTFAPADVGRRVRVQVTSRRRGYVPSVTTSAPQAKVRHRVDVRRTATYSVATRGHITADLKKFKRLAQQTYNDPRGWRGKGVKFRRVASGGAFTLVLAEASTVPSFSSACSATYSCRVGRYVIINQTRWQQATPPWNQAGGSLRNYRHMVVNHETGHWLGKGHASCPGPGRLAPVMQQQSKGLGGCRFNPWPTAGELS